MIKEKDVVRMRIPYPSIAGGLAQMAHMYICNTADCPVHEFIKCQTLKPYMIVKGTMKHYLDEEPDISRNPFQRTTRIDCDKLFTTETVDYDNKLRTPSRPDICQELYDSVTEELLNDGYNQVHINEDELLQLNLLIRRIIE